MIRVSDILRTPDVQGLVLSVQGEGYVSVKEVNGCVELNIATRPTQVSGLLGFDKNLPITFQGEQLRYSYVCRGEMVLTKKDCWYGPQLHTSLSVFEGDKKAYYNGRAITDLQTFSGNILFSTDLGKRCYTVGEVSDFIRKFCAGVVLESANTNVHHFKHEPATIGGFTCEPYYQLSR